MNERGAVTSWRAYYHSSGGSGFVYVKDAADRPRVAALLESLKRDRAHGIREVWNAEQLAAQARIPDAAFALDVEDGLYSGAGHDVLVKAASNEGGHGFGPIAKRCIRLS